MSGYDVSLKENFNAWARVYYEQPELRVPAEANLKAHGDLIDDGQANGSWEIVDDLPSYSEVMADPLPGYSVRDPNSGKTFDQWMKELPEDVKGKLKERFAGEDGKFSEEEKLNAVRYLQVLTGDDAISADDTATLRKDLKVPGSGNSGSSARFDEIMKQLPEDIKSQLMSTFAGPDGVYSDKEKQDVVNYVDKLVGTDGISEADKTKLKGDLSADTYKAGDPKVNARFDELMKALPEDLKERLKSRFAGADGKYSDQEKADVVKFLNGLTGTDGVNDADLKTVKNQLDLLDATDEADKTIATLFDALMAKLPPDIRDAVDKKFAGPDGKYTTKEREEAINYLTGMIGSDGLDTGDLQKLREDLKLEAPEGGEDYSASNARFDELMNVLPEALKEQLKTKFAGADGVYSDKEKQDLVNYVDNMAGTDGISDEDTKKLHDDLGAPAPGDPAINARFDELMKAMPGDIKSALDKKFAGPDGIYSPAEKAEAVKYLNEQTGSDGLNDADFAKLREGLNVK